MLHAMYNLTENLISERHSRSLAKRGHLLGKDEIYVFKVEKMVAEEVCNLQRMTSLECETIS